MATTNDELKQILFRLEAKIDHVVSLDAIKTELKDIRDRVTSIEEVVESKIEP